MKVSEYIAALEALKAEHGDLEVWNGDGRITAHSPCIAYRLLNARAARFWLIVHGESRKGEKVIRV